jgi:hypothetical protein
VIGCPLPSPATAEPPAGPALTLADAAPSTTSVATVEVTPIVSAHIVNLIPAGDNAKKTSQNNAGKKGSKMRPGPSLTARYVS